MARHSRPVHALAILIAATAIAVSVAGCGGDSAGTPQGNPANGEQLVLAAGSGETRGTRIEPACGMCHTMEAAELVGTTAPDLDRLAPGYDLVYRAIRVGPGAMPSYEGTLTDQEMHDVAAYISNAVRQPSEGN